MKKIFIVLGLILAGSLLVMTGKILSNDKGETELFQRYYDTVASYDKALLLEGEERVKSLGEVEESFTEIALDTKEDKLGACAFYSLGTIWLEEFRRDKSNILNLKKAIIYLQESLRRDPGLEKTQRNLERAWRYVEEKELMDEFDDFSESEGQESDEKGQGQGDGEEGKTEESEESGTQSTDNPLPFSEEDGYGRGKEEKDY